MMKPENRIECCIWNYRHVTSIADQTMNGVMQVLDAIIIVVCAIGKPGIGERRIVGLRSKKLVGHVMETTLISLWITCENNPRLTLAH